MKKQFKEVLRISSDAMLYVSSITLVITLWFNSSLLASASICMCVLAIACYILSLEKITFKNIAKEISVDFFLILILLGISRLINNENLFRIGLVLFVFLTLVYAFFAFLKKNDGENKGEQKDGKKNK